MKTPIRLALLAVLALFLAQIGPATGAGFTDGAVSFYGEVRQAGGGGTILLQAGQLEMTFVNQANPSNRVTLKAPIRPTGVGATKPYSYFLQAPLAYLPEPPRMGDFLSIGGTPTSFRIESILINGTPATLPDGSSEFFPLSFANRGDQYQLDLLVVGDSDDTDGDGLPDWYEELHGLDPNFADADGDLDEDGWSNIDEFLRGSSPSTSNREPSLATAELRVPELGEAGCFLVIHDSDSGPTDVWVKFDLSDLPGFGFHANGDSMGTGISSPVTLADLQHGAVTLVHLDPAIRQASLPVTWGDDLTEHTGTLLVNAVTPSREDGIDAALWLDATTLPPDQPVTTWTDRSGNARHATQPLAESRPTAETIHGHTSVHFTGDNSHLFFNDTIIPTGNHTIFAVWDSEGTRTERQAVLSSNRSLLRLDATALAVSYPGAPFYQSDGQAVRGYESTLGEVATAIFRREGNEVRNIYGLFQNGQAATAETLDPVLPTLGARRLALAVEDPVVEHFEGHLHELLVFPTALPEQKLRDVHDCLQSKWGGSVVWDFSTDLRPVTLATESLDDRPQIIRGGHANDDLQGGGGAGNNILSGGPGDDILRGRPGTDTFVFGGVDTGDDVIVGFGPGDTIDLSALFWGATGDARSYLTTRLDTNFSTPVPTLDTVLIVQRPDTTIQEITLQNTILGSQQIIQMVTEGQLRMGGLGIPTTLQIAGAAGSVIREASGEALAVEVSRGGEGTAAALDVPLGLFQEAVAPDFLVEGASAQDGQRAVVRFERGETTKTIRIRAVPDLESEGDETWEAAILPHYRYSILGSSLTTTVSDDALVSISALQPHAVAETGQTASIRVSRDPMTASSLQVTLEVLGTAVEGVHLNSIPRTVVIPAGADHLDLAISPTSGWDDGMTRMAMVRVVSGNGYLAASPHEATLYATATAAGAMDAGFDHWLAAATSGSIRNLHELVEKEGPDGVESYLLAYAYGLSTPEAAGPPRLSFRLSDGRPELTAAIAPSAADLQWDVERAGTPFSWTAADFTESRVPEGMRFLGEPVVDPRGFYRLRFSLVEGARLGNGLAAFGTAERYGMNGPANWEADAVEHELQSSGGSPGEVSRLLVELAAPVELSLGMGIRDGDGSGRLSLYVDGALAAETHGDVIGYARSFTGAGTVRLVWEFRHDGGTAFITDQP